MPGDLAIQKNKKVSNTAFTSHREKLVRGGKEYFELLLRLISTAKDSIHLQTYIFEDDETGEAVADALRDAARRNVEVYLLVDGYASQSLSWKFINSLRKAGIHFRFFEPLFRSRYFYFGRRMHHKVFVADGKFALVGGINIANRYNDLPGTSAWLDFALYVEDEIARQLCILCWKTWNGFPAKMGPTPCDKDQPDSVPATGERGNVIMRRNDWVRGKNQISKAYIQMLRNAESQVIILCSYFLPGKVIRKNIVRAVKRGVNVKVITAGSSDVMLAKNAERWLYDWLLRKGVELYEYEKNILHGKLAVCDDKWMTIGSYNINDISAYASIELNLDVYSPEFTKQTRKELEIIIAEDCIRITPEYQVRTKNILKRFVRWYSYQSIRIMFRLFTFYFKRQR